MRLNIKQMTTSVLLFGLMFGLMFGLTVGGAALAASDKQESRIETALATAQKVAWIAQGQGRRVVYVIFDPNCAYCPLLYKNLQPLIAPYDLQLRWIPVAILDATSLGKAAAIMQAKEPQGRARLQRSALQHGDIFRKHFRRDSVRRHRGASARE
jgi:hypothetical protein